jgi:Arc/MetJ-type ribon-helix-helix transcriptional regulator
MVEAEEMTRTPISVTLPKTCVEWIDRKVENRTYANRSHALEVLILDAMKNDEKKQETVAHTETSHPIPLRS